MDRKFGASPPPLLGRGWVPMYYKVPWAEAYLHTSRLATINMGRKFGSNTKWLGQGLPPYQVASWSIHPAIWQQQVWVENWGGCARFGEGELGPHLTQYVRGRGLPACQVSSWWIQPFDLSAPTLQTGQTTDRQHIGRTVLQTVPKTRLTFHKGIATKIISMEISTIMVFGTTYYDYFRCSLFAVVRQSL